MNFLNKISLHEVVLMGNIYVVALSIYNNNKDGDTNNNNGKIILSFPFCSFKYNLVVVEGSNVCLSLFACMIT